MVTTKLALALFLHASAILAVDLVAPIVGCSEVDCPSAANSTSADCRVVDHQLSLIGLANLNTTISKDDFTWTEGIQVYDHTDPKVANTRIYEKNFYLGVPEGLDLVKNAKDSGFGACALFFTQVAKSVQFHGTTNSTTVGTCNDALNKNCVDALLKQATDVAAKFTSSKSCETLQAEFAANLASQCTNVATGDKWQGLQVQDLTGSTAPKPYTNAENSTSNCYPTLPKTNSLTLVSSYNTTGTVEVASITENLFSITPVLTLFFPAPGGDSSKLLTQPEAQLTCLKGTGLTDAANATASTTDKNKDSAAAGDLALSRRGVVMLGLGLMAWFWGFA